MNNSEKRKFINLSTNHLNSVSNFLLRLNILFSPLKSNFNKLPQSKVDTINSTLNEVKPKIDEILSDVFIENFMFLKVNLFESNLINYMIQFLVQQKPISNHYLMDLDYVAVIFHINLL